MTELTWEREWGKWGKEEGDQPLGTGVGGWEGRGRWEVGKAKVHRRCSSWLRYPVRAPRAGQH